MKKVISLIKQLVEPYENNDNLIDYWFKSRTLLNRSESITMEFRSLLEGSLKFEPSSRLSAEQFIKHSFFKVRMFHKYIKISKICISTILTPIPSSNWGEVDRAMCKKIEGAA